MLSLFLIGILEHIISRCQTLCGLGCKLFAGQSTFVRQLIALILLFLYCIIMGNILLKVFPDRIKSSPCFFFILSV